MMTCSLAVSMVVTHSTHTFPALIRDFRLSLRDFPVLEHSNPSSQVWPVIVTLLLCLFFVNAYRQLGSG